jgi:hypothetical protein
MASATRVAPASGFCLSTPGGAGTGTTIFSRRFCRRQNKRKASALQGCAEIGPIGKARGLDSMDRIDDASWPDREAGRPQSVCEMHDIQGEFAGS